MQIRSLQSHILALFLLLMVGVQVGGFALIKTAGMSAARETIGENLVAGTVVFDRLLEQNTQRLVQGVRLMSADYKFREVIARGDRNTVASVATIYGRRIDASLMMIVGLDERVLADTLGIATGKPFAFPDLMAKAKASQMASAMVLIRGHLYQLVVVPVLAPTPIGVVSILAPTPTAWVAIGFIVDDDLTQDLQRLTRLDVSFVSRHESDPWRLQASTLSAKDRAALLDNVAAERFTERDPDGNAQYSDEAVTRMIAFL